MKTYEILIRDTEAEARAQAREARRKARERSANIKYSLLAIGIVAIAVITVAISGCAIRAASATDTPPIEATPTADRAPAVTLAPAPVMEYDIDGMAGPLLETAPALWATEGGAPLDRETVEEALLAHGYLSDAVPMAYEYQDFMRTYCAAYGCPYPLAVAVAETESNFDIRANAEAIVTNIRRDSLEGIVMPDGWKLELLSTGGERQFDTNKIIERYDTRIAMTVLADFVLLGHQDVGSFALSSNKTHMFAMAICSYLDIICETFNSKAIPQLLAMNGDHFGDVTDYPTLTHGDVEDTDIGPLGDFLSKMTTAGLIVPDEEIEDYLREVSGLPDRLSDYSLLPGADRNPGRIRGKEGDKPKDAQDTPPQGQQGRGQDDKKMGALDDENDVTPDDPEAVEKAKAALWRE